MVSTGWQLISLLAWRLYTTRWEFILLLKMCLADGDRSPPISEDMYGQGAKMTLILYQTIIQCIMWKFTPGTTPIGFYTMEASYPIIPPSTWTRKLIQIAAELAWYNQPWDHISQTVGCHTLCLAAFRKGSSWIPRSGVIATWICVEVQYVILGDVVYRFLSDLTRGIRWRGRDRLVEVAAPIPTRKAAPFTYFNDSKTSQCKNKNKNKNISICNKSANHITIDRSEISTTSSFFLLAFRPGQKRKRTSISHNAMLNATNPRQ